MLHDRLQYTIVYVGSRFEGKIYLKYLYIIFEFDTRILLSNITATYEACDISLPSDIKSNCIELEY